MRYLELLIPITFLLSVFGVIYLYLKSRHIEKMAMIENAVDAKSIYNKEKTRSYTLKIAMLLIGIAVGNLIAFSIIQWLALAESNVIHFTLTFLFAGLALLLNYRIERKKP
ncbi:MAG: DUF6249 domain-containing protein [Bacteroidota bacterium]